MILISRFSITLVNFLFLLLFIIIFIYFFRSHTYNKFSRSYAQRKHIFRNIRSFFRSSFRATKYFIFSFFEAFHWTISASLNSLFLKSILKLQFSSYVLHVILFKKENQFYWRLFQTCVTLVPFDVNQRRLLFKGHIQGLNTNVFPQS